MAEVSLTCIQKGVFRAETEQDMIALKRFKIGDGMRINPVKIRNYKFHSKFFALLNFAYDHFEPVTEYKGEPVLKNFDRFREDVTILAGYFSMTVAIDGSPKAKADSLSFSNMDDIKFEALYSSVVNVIIARVLNNYTRDDIDNTINQILSFT